MSSKPIGELIVLPQCISDLFRGEASEGYASHGANRAQLHKHWPKVGAVPNVVQVIDEQQTEAVRPPSCDRFRCAVARSFLADRAAGRARREWRSANGKCAGHWAPKSPRQESNEYRAAGLSGMRVRARNRRAIAVFPLLLAPMTSRLSGRCRRSECRTRSNSPRIRRARS